MPTKSNIGAYTSPGDLRHPPDDGGEEEGGRMSAGLRCLDRSGQRGSIFLAASAKIPKQDATVESHSCAKNAQGWGRPVAIRFTLSLETVPDGLSTTQGKPAPFAPQETALNQFICNFEDVVRGFDGRSLQPK